MNLIKKISMAMLGVLTLVSTFACQTIEEDHIRTYQKDIARVSQFSTELPENYHIIDFKQRALAFDQMIFDFEASGTFFPLIWADETYNTYGISAYIGDYRKGMDGSQEAVTSIAAVLSASLLGIDKTNDNGYNFVTPLNVYFNETEEVVINNPSGNSRNISMWYMIYPAILFTQVSIQYENEALLRENTLKTIESWYQAYLVMNALNDYNFTGFDFDSMKPYKNGVWTEPDSAVGISQLMYYGYKITHDNKYKEAAINALKYINDTYNGSSMYEILLYFGPYLSALYNQEFGTEFNVERMFNQVFNGNSIPRGGWGMLNDNYNGFAVSGLMGSISDGGGYAFSMNGYSAAFIMAKTAKYDTRYASSIGKWMNHLISNSRYYFADYAKDENESMFNSEFASDAQAFNEIAKDVIPYEGIRKSGNSKSPWFGGDPTVYNWAQTDFSLYSGASMGMLASLYETTNIESILKIDLNAGDYYQKTFPTYLLYNPSHMAQTVSYTPQSNQVTLYDIVSEKVILENVSGITNISIPATESVIIVEVPQGQTIERTDNVIKAGDVVISNTQATLNILSHQNNDEVSKNFTLTVDTVLHNPSDKVAYYEVILDGKTTRFETNKLKLTAQSGSKTLTILVVTENGLKDNVSLRLRIK